MDIVYPIGFFKGSEDVYSKFLTQGEKWAIESNTAPENKKLYMSTSATAKGAAGGAKEAKLTSVFRFDDMSGGDGFKTKVELNTDENWATQVGFYKKKDGDEHRVLFEHGYATRNADGSRRIPLLSELAAAGTQVDKSFKGTPLKVGYRLISSDYMALVEANTKYTWEVNVGASVAGAVVGGKVYNSGNGPSFDFGVGGKHDLFQGYAKFARAAKKDGEETTATLLVHPRIDTNSTFGLSFVAKAVVDVAKQGLKEAGVTVTGAVPTLKGYDWKLNLTKKDSKLALSKAISAKLPGKWTLGVGASLDDVSNGIELKSVKVGVKLTQGSAAPAM